MFDATAAGHAAAAQTRRPHEMRTCPTWSSSLFLLRMHHILLQSKMLCSAVQRLLQQDCLTCPVHASFVKAHNWQSLTDWKSGGNKLHTCSKISWPDPSACNSSSPILGGGPAAGSKSFGLFSASSNSLTWGFICFLGFLSFGLSLPRLSALCWAVS